MTVFFNIKHTSFEPKSTHEKTQICSTYIYPGNLYCVERLSRIYQEHNESWELQLPKGDKLGTCRLSPQKPTLLLLNNVHEHLSSGVMWSAFNLICAISLTKWDSI